jgi:AcrR family transcriptional regulator
VVTRAPGHAACSDELRADAQRNRARIVQAAGAAFAEQGLDVCVDEIARRAGVGMGTLYRRFPTKAQLVQAIFEERLRELEPVAEQALAGDDPWAGLTALVHATVASQAADQGLLQMLARSMGADVLAADARERFFAPFQELLARSQRAGQVRGDVAPGDLPALLRMAGAAAVAQPGAAADDGWPRHVALLLDGLRAQPEAAA